MKRLALFFGAVAIFSFASAQDITDSAKKTKKSAVSTEYDRNSMTYLGVDFAEQLSGQVLGKFSELPVPEKFYDNTVEPKVFSAAGKRDSYSTGIGFMKKLTDASVIQLLNENKIGQKIVAKWFNRQADGTFNVNMLKERGMFNANDNDFVVASASKRGESALMDMGLGLVDKSYVLVVDFDKIMSMDQYYTQAEIPTAQRIMNGYKATVHGYLYKLNFNDSVAAYFFQDYWTSEKNPAKAAAFDAANFPFIPVAHYQKDMMGVQYNPGQMLAPKVQKSGDELMKQLAEAAVNSFMTETENKNEDFRVKAFVSAVKPIAAKIGKKEGLQFDQRYFVYENKSRKNGDVYSVRKAVVKAMKVVDNRKVSTGETEPSLFYQIAGGKVDSYGMFLEQKNDVGANFILGFTEGGLSGLTGRLEYYIGKPFYKAGTLSKGLRSLKLYVEAGYNTGLFDNPAMAGIQNVDFSFFRYNGGVSKDFYLTNFLHFSPFVGYGIENATWKDSKDKITSDFIEAGARLGINLSYNIQLIGSFNYYLMLTGQYLKEDGTVDATKVVDYATDYERGNDLGMSIGLRIMF